MGMSAKEFDVNGTDYSIAITDQVIGHVNNLKNLYNAAYEDPESFEDGWANSEDYQNSR
jgi:hypothetical protein